MQRILGFVSPSAHPEGFSVFILSKELLERDNLAGKGGEATPGGWRTELVEWRRKVEEMYEKS